MINTLVALSNGNMLRVVLLMLFALIALNEMVVMM